jgi:Tol biopolymer transport system component
VAFVSYLDGDADIYIMDADGSKQQRLTQNDAEDTDPSW